MSNRGTNERYIEYAREGGKQIRRGFFSGSGALAGLGLGARGSGDYGSGVTPEGSRGDYSWPLRSTSSIFWTRRAWRPPSKLVCSQTSTIRRVSSSPIKSAGRQRTFALL